VAGLSGNCRSSHLFNGNLNFLNGKWAFFGKMVDQIRGVFNVGVGLVGPGLRPTPPPPLKNPWRRP